MAKAAASLAQIVLLEMSIPQNTAIILAQVITAAIILLCHSSYASVGFPSTDVISREINDNLHRHSCTHKAVNKYTCTLSCIRIHTPTEAQRDANPARL